MVIVIILLAIQLHIMARSTHTKFVTAIYHMPLPPLIIQAIFTPYLFVTFRVNLPHFKSGNNGIMEFAGVKPLVYKVQ